MEAPAAGSAAGSAAGHRLGGRALRWLGVLGPAAGLAVLGTQHPYHLRPDTAQAWWVVHLWGMPLFPLLALGPWLVLGPPRGGPGRRAAVWSVRVLLGVYAVYYSALDDLAGVGAGELVRSTGVRGDAGVLIRQGDVFGHLGASALLVALVALVVLLAHEARTARGWGALPPLLPGALLAVVAGESYLSSHVFYPRGVLTVLALAAGLLALDAASLDAAAPGQRLDRPGEASRAP